jgi:hypothetical protein
MPIRTFHPLFLCVCLCDSYLEAELLRLDEVKRLAVDLDEALALL